ncbi:uncharacterized protein LOC143240290 [Tachypleus tridentatus]|uniref:uncharacterized protein LOC143240290 n=1 Tax=Tachypleus tridentatus TaxID=6853 RepID=UPI003FD22FD1
MELKVWVEGIQRVVCGVTENTTCQDVVFALAHATGQTGRFTLVEKWRNSERLLAPQDNPLKVLLKWGEHANDVQFILRRSQPNSKAHGASVSHSHQNNKRQHEFFQNFPPPAANLPVQNQKSSSTQSKEIKKSLTFSGSHGSSGSSSNTTPNTSSTSTPSKFDSVSHELHPHDVLSRQDVPRGVVRGVPQKPREQFSDSDSHSSPSGTKAERPQHPPPYDEAIHRSNVRFPTSQFSPTGIDSYPHVSESPSSKRRHVATSRIEENARNAQRCLSPHQQIESSKFKKDDSTSCDMANSKEPQDSRWDGRISKEGQLVASVRAFSPTQEKPQQANKHYEEISASRVKKNLINHFDQTDIFTSDAESQLNKTSLFERTSQNIKTRKAVGIQEEISHDPQFHDLVRLVSLQREKLSNQQAEISQYDAEIVYWEGKLQEQEERLASLEEEVRQLERTEQEYNEELDQLDRRPLAEEVDVCRQEERTLRSELTLARSQLANCETELLQCRQRVRQVLEEIANERRRRMLLEEQVKQQQREQEQQIQEELEILNQKMMSQMEEYDIQKECTEKLERKMNEMDTLLSESEKLIEKLTQELREENLKSLSMTVADEMKHFMEGNFHNRPGSTRKIIGSPRQLENAVPTNKNPHGVWV